MKILEGREGGGDSFLILPGAGTSGVVHDSDYEEYLEAAAIVIQENWRDYRESGALQPHLEEEIKAAFAAFDLQGRGAMPSRELRVILSTRGEKMGDVEIDAILDVAGGEGQAGTVKFDTLTNEMLGKGIKS